MRTQWRVEEEVEPVSGHQTNDQTRADQLRHKHIRIVLFPVLTRPITQFHIVDRLNIAGNPCQLHAGWGNQNVFPFISLPSNGSPH